jgi:hypothetical protein
VADGMRLSSGGGDGEHGAFDNDSDGDSDKDAHG